MPRFLRAAACVFFLGLVAEAQQSAVQPSPSGPGSDATCVLEGIVLNAQTGEPVRKAQVTAFWLGGRTNRQQANQEPRSATTDVSGRFSLTGLTAGRYRLRAEGNRFAPQGYNASRPGGPGKVLELDPGQQLRGLTFRLPPAGAIMGTVYDEDGDPVMGATLLAFPIGKNRSFQQGNQVPTNDLGQYRVYNLMPGQYILHASLPGDLADEKAGITYVPTFYGDTTDPGAAVPISVQPGSETQNVDINVRPVRAVRVRGQLVNQASGQAAQGAYVALQPRTAASGSEVEARFLAQGFGRYNGGTNDAQGHFEIRGVPAGSYWAFGMISEKDRTYTGRVAVDVGEEDVDGVTIPVGAGITLSGRVRVEPQKSFDFSRLNVILSPEDEPMFGSQGAQAAADGTFTLPNVAPETYRVRVVGFPEEYYVKSAQSGGGDLLDTGLSVDPAGRPGPLDIVLSSAGGSISGAVLKDHQPAPAMVYFVPDPPRRDRHDLYSVKRTNADGTFTLLGLPPGDYKLFAFEDPQPGLESDPAILQPYEAKGESVHVEDGRSQSVQLEQIPAEDEE